MADQRPPAATRSLQGDKFKAFEVWGKYEEIAMHFNDLILKLRFQALAGVAGLSASIGLLAERFGGASESQSRVVALAFGVLAVLWVALFVLDFFYYNRLLLGAVEEIVKVEEESQYGETIGRLGFSQTVKDEVEAPILGTKWRKSQRGPLIFYAIVFGCLVGLTIFAACQP